MFIQGTCIRPTRFRQAAQVAPPKLAESQSTGLSWLTLRNRKFGFRHASAHGHDISPGMLRGNRYVSAISCKRTGAGGQLDG